MKLVCDMDGVFSNWNKAFAALLVKTSRKFLLPLEHLDDPTWPDCWHWPQAHGYSDYEVDKAWRMLKDDNKLGT